MTIQQVIDDVSNGELKQLAIKSDSTAIISYINLGLIELYKRFAIKTNEVTFQLKSDQNVYTMPDDYQSIIEVIDSDNNTYFLKKNNDTNDEFVITVPSYQTIHIAKPKDDTELTIRYSTLPVRIENTTDTLPIPLTLLDALYNYIGYRAHGSMNGDVKAENNTHYMRFEANCKKAKDLGVLTQDDIINNKLTERGFV